MVLQSGFTFRFFLFEQISIDRNHPLSFSPRMVGSLGRIYLADSKNTVRQKTGLSGKDRDEDFAKFQVCESFSCLGSGSLRQTTSIFVTMSITSSLILDQRLHGRM